MHKKFDTPHLSLILVTIAVAVISGFFPLQVLSHLVSLGTLFSFVMVAIGVMVLRKLRPELERPFKCPAVFIVAPIAILACGYLIYNLLTETWKPFVIWCIIGLIFYFSYGYRNSPLKRK